MGFKRKRLLGGGHQQFRNVARDPDSWVAQLNETAPPAQETEEKNEVGNAWHRQRAKVWFTSRDPGYSSANDIRHEQYVEYDDPEANLITSQIEGTEFHAPVLDFDFPCELAPSNTEGHFHLLLNKPISWEKYEILLKSLQIAGLVEPGWVKAALTNKKSAIRARGVLKYEIELYRDNLTTIVDSLEQEIS